MLDFIPGLKLSALFYTEAVAPILAEAFPGLAYTAARIGPGSEVLGFDTAQSTDHDWGPRLQLFLAEDDAARYGEAIGEVLSERLPRTFRGYSTHFGPPDDEGTRLLEAREHGPVDHRVEVHAMRGYLADYLGLDLDAEMTPIDWLTFSEQKLRSVMAGAVFRDDVGLHRVRERLAAYPDDVWRYLLAADWTRIAQEEPFVGRCGDVGDELGSRLIAGRIVYDLMHLCFLMAREYAPYNKWFGTAFVRLECAADLAPVFHAVLSAETWRERERHLARAYAQVATLHNALGITPPLPTEVTPFFGRPYLIIHGDVFAEAIRATIIDPAVRAIRTPVGSVNQFVNSTDVLSRAERCRFLRGMYDV